MCIYRTEKWFEFLGTKHVSNYQRICSDHFEEKCFQKIYPRRLLWKNSIPTIKNLSLLENRLEEQEISNDKTCKKKIYKICNKYIINIFKFTKHTNKLFYFR